MYRVTLWLLAALLSCPSWSSEAAAQNAPRYLRVVPTAGWYLPVRDARVVGEGTSAAWTRVAEGPMLGVQAEWKPHFPVSLRGGLLAALSDLELIRNVGTVSCGERCYRAVYETDPVGGTRVFLGVADLLVRGPHLWVAQPYLVLGGGLKHYAFDQGELRDEVAAAFPDDETDPAGHLALGLDLTARGYTVVAEAGTYLSTFDPAPETAAQEERSGQLQSDVALTLGVRIRLR